MFHKQNKSELFTPGFILILHTFGRDLKWNPHIHALISEGGAGNHTVWRPCTHFDFIKKLIVHIPEKHFKMLRYYIMESMQNTIN